MHKFGSVGRDSCLSIALDLYHIHLIVLTCSPAKLVSDNFGSSVDTKLPGLIESWFLIGGQADRVHLSSSFYGLEYFDTFL